MAFLLLAHSVGHDEKLCAPEREVTLKKSVPAVADDANGTVAPPEIDRAFLTTVELQKTVLPLSRRSILEWRKKGIIPSVQIGSKVLFHKKAVIEALCRRQSGGIV